MSPLYDERPGSSCPRVRCPCVSSPPDVYYIGRGGVMVALSGEAETMPPLAEELAIGVCGGHEGMRSGEKRNQSRFEAGGGCWLA